MLCSVTVLHYLSRTKARMATTVITAPGCLGMPPRIWEINISYITYAIKNYKVLLCHIVIKHKGT